VRADPGLERVALGCVLTGFRGLTPPDWLLRDLARGLGGVVLFARNNVRSRDQVVLLCSSLHRDAPHCITSLDEEGGDVTRLEVESGSSYPGQAALGAVDDAALTERTYAALAGELRRVGINLNLAPVADVNTNPDNPVIGVRSFGSDPVLVARHVAAAIRGHHRAGVAACAKHFPGHGDTSQDSHLELPVSSLDPRALEPFRAAIEAGVDAVMTAHIRVPELGEEPATLNPRAFALLREELGFRGAAITDALEMQAIAATLGMGEAGVQAVAAGGDGLCLGAEIEERHVREVVDALVHAVRAGRLPEERLAEAAGRIARVPDRASAGEPEDVSATVGLEGARRALRVEGDVDAWQPTNVVIELQPEPSLAAGPAGQGLGAALAARLPGVQTVVVNEFGRTADSMTGSPLLVLRDAHRHACQRAIAESLPDAVVVETGLPLWRPPHCRAYVATYGAGRVNLEAAAELLASRSISSSSGS
jgi:beta-N-acetylhexosaminidase